MITTAVDVWVERSPDEREFITRNLECLQCHTELIPDLARSAVHDPFLREQCTVCHTPHGEEVTERVTSGGWSRMGAVPHASSSGFRSRSRCEAFESIRRPSTDGGRGRRGPLRDHSQEKGEESMLVADRDGAVLDMPRQSGRQKLPMPNQHAPFENGLLHELPQPACIRRPGAAQARGAGPVSLVSSDVRGARSRDQLHPPYEGRYCTNCHDPHASEWTGILVDNQRDLCFTCHPSVAPL